MQVSHAVKLALPTNARRSDTPIPATLEAEERPPEPGPSEKKSGKAADLPEWKAARNAWQADRKSMSSVEWFAARAAWMQQRDVALGKVVAEPGDSAPPETGETEAIPTSELEQPVDADAPWADLMPEAETQPEGKEP